MATVRLALVNPGNVLQTSPILRSSPSNSVHANRFFSPNKLLSIKPVLLGVDWIPLILRYPVSQSTRATILVGHTL